ncbi:MAG: hypothetical protein HY063_07530 [Bacteroidetes bacterium]|nr:hypothetical protein [Bacteroidota bacterium]
MKKIILKASDYARFIILLAAASKKNLPKILLITDIGKLEVTVAVSTCKGIVTTGDPDAGGVTPTDGTLHAQADTLLNIHTARQTKPPTKTADDEIKQRNIVNRTYKKMALYVQGVCNDVAVANGDVTAGETVAQRTGFGLKKKGQPHPRDFEFLPSDKGSFHARVKSTGAGHMVYLYEYGITTAENVMPPVWEKPVALPVTELIVKGFASGTIVGVHYTVILPPAHTKKTSAKISETASMNATKLTINKARKVTVTHGSDLYNFSNILYVRIP